MASRKISDLVPELQSLYYEFEKKMEAAGIDFIVTCTYRSQEEQDKLYAQGRTGPGFIVTWTKDSKHTRREAFDIAVITKGKLNWGNKAYEKPGLIGESVGLKWGGRFKKKDGTPCPDRPHFEIKESVIDSIENVADDVSEIAQTGMMGGQAQGAAVAYEVAKGTGILRSVKKLFKNIFGIFGVK